MRWSARCASCYRWWAQPTLLGVDRRAWPVVGSEGSERQAFFAVDVADGVVGPGVADGGGVGDFIAGDLDRVIADELGVGPDELLVAAGDGEANGFVAE